MLDCNHFNDSYKNGHCPFDVICDKYCYFTHKLENDNGTSRSELEDELENAYCRISELETLLKEAYVELGQDCFIG